MSTPHADGQKEGERRKDAAHALLEARREYWIRRARRALLEALMERGSATADDVAERLGDIPDDIDPRWLGTVPGRLASANIIRRVGFTKSRRPPRHASYLSIWELVGGHDAARDWLAAHPELPEPDDNEDDAGPLS